MELPKSTQQAIEYCRQQMFDNPKFNLLLKDRLHIYKTIDELGEPLTTRIYTRLAILSVRKVLPVWVETFTNSDLIEDRLLFAERFLIGRMGQEEIEDKLNDFEYDRPFRGAYSKVIEEWMQSRSYLVYKAADATVNVAMGHGKLWQWQPLYRIQKGWADERTDDPISLSVVAYSGRDTLDDIVSNSGILLHNGISADPDFSPARRREFWEWWLAEAIFTSWQLAYSDKRVVE